MYSTEKTSRIRNDKAIARRVQQVKDGGSFMEGIEDLRIASFGSAITLGAGLDNEREAYPYLISNRTDNYAVLSGNPNFPAVCTQTLIGDERMYDVILLEYWLAAEQGLKELAEKLRNRFPDAMIILVKVMTPVHARRKESKSSKKHVSFQEWKDKNGLKAGVSTNAIINAIEADDGFWFFPKRAKADRYVGRVKKSIGAFRVRLEHRPTDKETLQLYLQLFDHKHTKLNALGHQFLGYMVKGTIENKLKFASPHALIENEKFGTWGKGDECQFWSSMHEYDEDHSESIEFNKWNRKGSFTLDINDSGNFTVHNKFVDERMLYVSFLTTSDDFFPPKIQTRIGSDGAPHQLQPSYTNPKHNVHTVPIGKIPAGSVTINVDFLEDRNGYPFRIVGLTLTDEMSVPHEFGFMPRF